MNKDFLLEEELYFPVRDYLIQLGFEVKGELAHCDICGIKKDQLLIVELKRGLTIELLVQATKRQKVSDVVYVAVPKPRLNFFSKRWKDICHLLKRLELGLILVSKENGEYSVKVVLEPAPFNKNKSSVALRKKRESLLNEFKGRSTDANIGGSKGKKLMTAYKEQAIKIARYIIENGTTSAAKLSIAGFDRRKAYTIMHKNHYGWFDKVGKGLYNANQKCLKEIQSYEGHGL